MPLRRVEILDEERQETIAFLSNLDSGNCQIQTNGRFLRAIRFSKTAGRVGSPRLFQSAEGGISATLESGDIMP